MFAGYETQISMVIVTLLSLFASGAISGTETAFTAASRPRLIAMGSEHHKGALRVLNVLGDPNRFISSILLSNNLVNIVSSAVITLFCVRIYGEAGAVYATAAMTVLIVMFGEIIPKSLAISRPTEFALTMSPFAWLLVTITYPFVAVIQFFVNLLLKIVGVNSKGIVDEDAIRLELRGTIDVSHQSGAVYKDEKERLRGLLDLRDLHVSDVMMHRRDIAMMDVDMPLRELVAEVLKTPYTRVPLYRENPENIVGVLHAKDVLRALVEAKNGFDDLNIVEIMRKPWFIPETTSVAVQLNKFLSHRNHFAIVVDEYGGLRGLVTLEDILEEIVGDIRDEHDIEIMGLRSQPDGSYIVNGKISIRDLNRATGWKLPDDNYTTIAGLVIHESRTIPEKGQSFNFYNIRFEILEKERNQIIKVRSSVIPNQISQKDA